MGLGSGITTKKSYIIADVTLEKPYLAFTRLFRGKVGLKSLAAATYNKIGAGLEI